MTSVCVTTLLIVYTFILGFLFRERKRLLQDNLGLREQLIRALRDARDIQGLLYGEIRELSGTVRQASRNIEALEETNKLMEEWLTAKGGKLVQGSRYQIQEDGK